MKTLMAACAVLAAGLGATVAPAEAQPFRHHHGYHHRFNHHHGFYRHHHRFHHRRHGIVGRVVRGVARSL